MKNLLEKTFKLTENKTTIRKELLAGLITFLTMSYILIVNPSILSTTGMD
ncbi:MAG: NCS2 family permease, partial [Prevotellaceae bacterium]|nr:NCS2 family permease [Prevotellaceae bacterium]